MIKNFKITGDKVLWVLVIVLSAISLLAIYSSTGQKGFREMHGNTEYFLIKQFMLVISGLIIMYFVHKVNFIYFSRSAQILLFVSVILMIITVFLSKKINGESRSLIVNLLGFYTLTIQTADLAKLVLMMYLARYLHKHPDGIKEVNREFIIGVVLPVLILCGLIMKVNLSTALILFVSSMGLLFLGRTSFKNLAAMVGIGVAGVLLLIALSAIIKKPILSRSDTWSERIERFLNKDSEVSEQVIKAKTAIAYGGIIGKMPGKSTQRNILPLSFSDYIYAIIIEEYGIIGGSTVILIYLIMLFRAIVIARLCRKPFGSYLVLGISFIMVFQAMVNMGVAVNLLPVTGQTLPFISLGGTSFWFSCAGIGMILSVSRSVEQTQPKETDKIEYATA